MPTTRKKKDTMELKEAMPVLIQLQKLDGQIFELKKRQKDIPLSIKKLEEDFKNEGELLKQAASDLKSIQVKHKSKETDLQAKEDSIKKHQTQLLQIKTNKEYTAMQQEIASITADKSALEDEIIGLLDEIDAAKKKVEGAAAELAKLENELNSDKRQKAEELKEIEAKLSGLESERSHATARIDKSTLSKYDRILHGKDGLALVPVHEEACGGCHLNLPPQVINEIKMMKELMFCESCARILYIEE